MVVIVILGVLAALVVPRVLERPDEARAIAAKSDIAAIVRRAQALPARQPALSDRRAGPRGAGRQARAAAGAANWKPGGYLEKLPKDPWGHPYAYLNPGLKGEIDVYSFGADGQPGGSGKDADIGSWDL